MDRFTIASVAVNALLGAIVVWQGYRLRWLGRHIHSWRVQLERIRNGHCGAACNCGEGRA